MGQSYKIGGANCNHHNNGSQVVILNQWISQNFPGEKMFFLKEKTKFPKEILILLKVNQVLLKVNRVLLKVNRVLDKVKT